MAEYLGLVWIAALSLSAWTILSVVGSSYSGGRKLTWIAVAVLLPGLGGLLWLLAGPKVD